MINRGIATFGLDCGKCPPWLFERMVNLGREMVRVLIEEYGPEEFIRRIADPVWFQSLGTVLAFDWNASGLTTILTAALKEAIRGREKEWGVFVCGGKGKTSLKTPEEIERWGTWLSLPESGVNNLVYNSKMAAKIDSALIQDGFQIYHHSFFFARNGAWAVVQQGMNAGQQSARRYHWHSEKITDLVCEPHSGITAPTKTAALNLTAKSSTKTREISVEITHQGYSSLMKDMRLLRRFESDLNQSFAVQKGQQQFSFLHLENKEFRTHPVLREDFSKSAYLEKILYSVTQVQPKNYEKLIALKGVGPKTVRALSLVAEVLYGAKPSYEDPARYSFAHGGKDATPYPVDRFTYDQSIAMLRTAVGKMHIPSPEKGKLLQRLL